MSEGSLSNENRSWRDYIKKEQLPQDYQLIAEVIGLDNTIKLAKEMSKVYIYLVSPDTLFLPAKKQYILDRYAQAGPDRPFNHRLIALETGLSIRTVYDIIADKKEELKQTKLFDDNGDD
ncbi:MAG: hypothetical protein ABFD75_11280 [Smithella sp.]